MLNHFMQLITAALCGMLKLILTTTETRCKISASLTHLKNLVSTDIFLIYEHSANITHKGT